MIRERLIGYIEESIVKSWNVEALSNYREKGYTYREIAEKILQLHIAFEFYGIKEGDKIALLGKNSAHWCITYLAVVTYGAVIVPVLPDFKPDDAANIINHSDSVLLFTDEKLWESLSPEKLPALKGIFSLEDFGLIMARDKRIEAGFASVAESYSKRYPELKPEHIRFASTTNDKLAVISYTSGTTGFSKGVMVNHNTLAANVRFAQKHMPLETGDPVVSFLPLAHTYGCAFEFLFPFTYGCHITILTKTPSPQIILQAFGEIKPRLILSVPLVIEKIYKKRLLPVISKPHMKLLLAIPGINKLLHKKIRETLDNSFGGRFKEVVIGGAALNPDAERFFRKIGFRFTVGYGMTECGPLISYASWDTTKLGASGRAVDTMEVKIDDPDPVTGIGEIVLRGENVMDGYYKNELATNEVIDSEGWMHTGDLGLIDSEGNIFIKGRIKNMILDASGKNIYPEEIEALYNNEYLIAESVVIRENGKLIALLHPDYEVKSRDGIGDEKMAELFEQSRKSINERLPSHMAVSKVRVHTEEFVKTPKRSIRRFLYTEK